MDYNDFLKSKFKFAENQGIEPCILNPKLFDWQKDITKWAVRRGSAALFTLTGTGKTLMQLEWADQYFREINQPVLIVAPLAVSKQTIQMAGKFGYNFRIGYAHNQDETKGFDIIVTNYERLGKFNPDYFGGVVLDESGILKSFSGKIKQEIIEMFSRTKYKLTCTATPAPNDYIELINHSDFLGVMKGREVLSTYFYHDGSDVGKWILKGHAEDHFWEWVASWAAVITNPEDLGYDGSNFKLPPLKVNEIIVKIKREFDDCLFGQMGTTLQDRQKARRQSVKNRCKKSAEIVNASNDLTLVWCDLNSESSELHRFIDDSVEVRENG